MKSELLSWKVRKCNSRRGGLSPGRWDSQSNPATNPWPASARLPKRVKVSRSYLEEYFATLSIGGLKTQLSKVQGAVYLFIPIPWGLKSFRRKEMSDKQPMAYFNRTTQIWDHSQNIKRKHTTMLDTFFQITMWSYSHSREASNHSPEWLQSRTIKMNHHTEPPVLVKPKKMGACFVLWKISLSILGFCFWNVNLLFISLFTL